MDSTLKPSPADILTLATEITNSPCHFIHNTKHEPPAGGEYIIYALETSTGSRLCIRIPKNCDNYTSMLLTTEAEFRQRINNVGVAYFQTLCAFSSTADNSVGSPFLALDWIDGSPLRWTDTLPATIVARQGILRTVAHASLDLLCINQNATVTARDWITAKIRRKIIRAQNGTLPGGTIAECEHQLELVENYWVPELDNRPHVLVHGDLSGNNIIVDQDQSVRGVIDLGWAELVPLQFAAVYPKFLTHEPVNGHAWERDTRNTEQMERDRAFYLQCIKERADQEKEDGMLMEYYRVLSRDDEIDRYWWFTAAIRIDVHRAMARCNWKPPMSRLAVEGAVLRTESAGLRGM